MNKDENVVVVTGGFGFIGSWVVEELFRGENNYIIVIDSMEIGSNINNIPDHIRSSKRFKHYNIDICNSVDVEAAFRYERPDIVLHLAAESHVDRSITDPDNFILTNVIGTHNILKVVKAHECRLVHVSTDEVYGQLDERGAPFLETDILDPRSPYSASKASSDLLVLSYIKTFGIKATVTRCCNNYGPRQFDEKLIPTVVNSLKNGNMIPVYGTGQNIREWIHAEDHAKAIIEISQNDPSEYIESNYIRNIPGRCSLSNLDLIVDILNIYNNLTSSTKTADEVIEYVEDRLGHDFKYEIATIYRKPLHSVKYQRNFSSGLVGTVKYYLGIVED
jgi:dTDP-glucose 4,6-dehydratase